MSARHRTSVDWDRRRDAIWSWIVCVAVVLAIFVAVLVLFE